MQLCPRVDWVKVGSLTNFGLISGRLNGLILMMMMMMMTMMLIYLLTAIGLTPGGSSTVHIYTQTVHREQHNEIEYAERNKRNNKNT